MLHTFVFWRFWHDWAAQNWAVQPPRQVGSANVRFASAETARAQASELLYISIDVFFCLKHLCTFIHISSHLFLFVYNILIFHPLQPDHVGQMGSLHVKCQHVPTRWWFGWSDSAGLFIGAARFTLRIPIHRWCIYHFCGQPYLGGCKYWVIRHPWVFDPQQVRFFLRNAGLKEEERLGIAWAAGLESQDVSKHL